jgi:hypothetical protein
MEARDVGRLRFGRAKIGLKIAAPTNLLPLRLLLRVFSGTTFCNQCDYDDARKERHYAESSWFDVVDGARSQQRGAIG